MILKKIFWVIRAILYKFFTKVGLPSYIGKPIYISRISGLSIGKRVRIYPGIRAEIETKNASITIGNNTSIGQNFHVVSYISELYIGNNVTISGNVFITNCSHNYQEIGVHILEQPIKTEYTKIGDFCFIGYGAVIKAGTVLGKQCIVGSNSVLKGTFPDYSVIAGNPAKIIKRYNILTGLWEKESDLA